MENTCCHLILFGATGDLALKKLLPSLYSLSAKGHLSKYFQLIAFARKSFTLETYLKKIKPFIQKYATSSFSEKAWKSFGKKLRYHQADFVQKPGFDKLLHLLKQLEKKAPHSPLRLFYLATPPSTYESLIKTLSENHLLTKNSPSNKVVIEKPFGYDSQSASAMQRSLLKYVHDSQILRIDHYLGKSMVHWLLHFRHSNPFFASLWDKKHLDHIQITLSEDIGIAQRGTFFEENGLVRDMVQNHLLQLICFTLMKLPKSLDASSIKRAKLRVLKALRPFNTKTLSRDVVIGQYSSSKNKKAYREEKHVHPESLVETFFAAKLFVDLPRYLNVPLYVRVGKRMKKKRSEVAIFFKPHQQDTPSLSSLVIPLNPSEKVAFYTPIGCPTAGKAPPPFVLPNEALRYSDYENLLTDLVKEEKQAFVSFQEVKQSWNFVDPLQMGNSKKRAAKMCFYPCGSTGPQQAQKLIENDHRQWRKL